MRTRLRAALMAALLAAASVSCSGGGIFGKQYEYEEDMTIALDGSATVVVNASLASLTALRGLPVPLEMRAADRDAIRALFTTPVTSVTRVSRPWTRKGRKFVQVRVDVSDVRRLHEAPPFAWSTYSFAQQGDLAVFTQVVGPSAMKPGSLKNYGWDGSEIVAFRLHLPSEIVYHNARDLDTNAPAPPARGNILAWEQHLADRLDGRPVTIEVRMESQSILYTTLWLFAGSFLAAVLLLVLLIWWFLRRGRDQPRSQT